MINDDSNDNILMIRYQNGDQEAFNELMSKYFKLACEWFKIQRAQYPTNEDPEDLAQLLFIRADKYKDNFRPGVFRNWLWSLAQNVARTSSKQYLFKWDHCPIETRDNEQLDKVEFEEKDWASSALVDSVLPTLPKGERDLIDALRSGLSVTKAAEKLGLSRMNVRTLRAKALKHIREAVKI